MALNHAFTDLERDDARRRHGRRCATRRRVARSSSGSTPAHRWLQLYTADDVPATARRSLAIEPMTANADAFRTGEDLLTLAPAGEPGDEVSVSWGVRAVEEQA